MNNSDMTAMPITVDTESVEGTDNWSAYSLDDGCDSLAGVRQRLEQMHKGALAQRQGKAA